MFEMFDDRGIRFTYPLGWEVEVVDEEPFTTVSVQSPAGLAFAMVTLDDSCPAPAEVADQALEAMREEYPQLDASPALETIDGHHAVGHDIEFISLDLTNTCAIRCFRTPRRTVLAFGQVGHDIEFISLDLTNTCAIRCFRTPRRTVLAFGQWSDLEEEDSEALVRGVWRSLEETDA